MAAIEFQGVSKVFPDGTRAVDSLELMIEDDEFMVFVGPSGCGKTTALRMVAGLEEVSDGTILIGGRPVNDVSSKDRDVAMVFQNYALYPHMTVAQNLAFGLKLRKIDKAEIRRRVQTVAGTLGLEGYLERKPSALSGGQRQRVAMGRAIVREPRAYLMDEPLSNLDAQLRVQMRAEIQRLQRVLGVTTIYVTHDQTEAMTMGDRIAVMRDGTLQQVDTPERVYRRPKNRFVAGFIGSPAMNVVSARLARGDGGVTASFGEHRLAIADDVIADRPGLVRARGPCSPRDPARGPRGRRVRRRGAARDDDHDHLHAERGARLGGAPPLSDRHGCNAGPDDDWADRARGRCEHGPRRPRSPGVAGPGRGQAAPRRRYEATAFLRPRERPRLSAVTRTRRAASARYDRLDGDRHRSVLPDADAPDPDGLSRRLRRRAW